MDRRLMDRSSERCSVARFLVWLAPWVAMLGVGLYAMMLCLRDGLYYTNMDNRFAFGLWIFLDLAIIAFGGGAFFSGFLLYILHRKELAAVIRSAVLIGFLCYSGAMLVLMVDVGQPMRSWFTFWHPNTHSMLTEVTFCISCYLVVLAIEYLPTILRHRRVRRIGALLVFEWELHKTIPVFAAVGTFLSFFHQGSLGGLYGLLRGRPFAFREGFGIWPTTFFLFILSAIAVGPSFLIVTTRAVEALTRRRLVRPDVYGTLARISGGLLTAYVMLKAIDTLVWLNSTSRRSGFVPWEYYAWPPFGLWILFAEIVLFGFVPAVWLLRGDARQPNRLLLPALLACAGVGLNRFVLTIQTLALPTLPFDEFMTYAPSWQESAAFLGVIAFGVIAYSFSYRYLKLFPQERQGE
jgi:molybdopterin-containing oxidoreductase family membrane subunit